jgi:hypothetical protein
MTSPFQFTVTADWTELRLAKSDGYVPVDLWAIEAPKPALTGVDLVRRLIAAEKAIAGDDIALIGHSAIAALSVREAAQLGLPPLAEVVAEIGFDVPIASPEFRVRLTWKRPNGQGISGAARTGAWLRIGEDWHRLPHSLFDIATAAAAVSAAGANTADQLAAIATLREVLPIAQSDGSAIAQGLAGVLTIVVADAFSLDLKGDNNDARLVPILHRAGANVDTAALDATQQAAFGDDQFNRFSTARAVYTLPGSTYVVLSPPLRRALAAVRALQSEPSSTKRALMRAPRAFLREALGDDTDDTVMRHKSTFTK